MDGRDGSHKSARFRGRGHDPQFFLRWRDFGVGDRSDFAEKTTVASTKKRRPGLNRDRR